MQSGRTALLAFASTACAAVALAQRPDLSGTWRLDAGRSRVEAEATLVGLIGAGAPKTLHVTQPANGTLVVESQVNESHARLYVPGRETSTPVFVGEAGTVTMRSRWEEGALVGEGAFVAGTGASENEVKEVYRLSADGRTLEIEIAISGAEGQSPKGSTLRYTRIDDVGPCESWPSPCKAPPR